MVVNSIQVEARPSALELDPKETAVIVVDMQQGFVGTGGAWDRMGVDPSNAQATVAPIARVLGASREVGMSIVYLTMNLDSGRRPDADFHRWDHEQLSGSHPARCVLP